MGFQHIDTTLHVVNPRTNFGLGCTYTLKGVLEERNRSSRTALCANINVRNISEVCTEVCTEVRSAQRIDRD